MNTTTAVSPVRDVSYYIMRYLLILLLFSISSRSFGQSCSCATNPQLKEIINCDTTFLNNKVTLYWQFNCDSSWLIFENQSGLKKVLYSLESPLIELTERLGYRFTWEYQKSFLIQNNLISGCCTPPEYLLFSKEKGTLITNLGPLIYYGEERNNNFVIYFTNKALNHVTLHYVDSGRKYDISLPAGRFASTLKKKGELYAERLFIETDIRDSIMTIEYRYQKKEKEDRWYTDNVVIDLNKYVR